MTSDEYEIIVVQIKDLADEMAITKDADLFAAMKMQYDYLVQAAQSLKDHQLAVTWDGEQDLADAMSSLHFSEITPVQGLVGTSIGTSRRVSCESCSQDCTAAHKHVPCGHDYCPDCMTQICQAALKNRAMIPSRCCKREFPIEYVKEALSELEYQQYEVFLKEKGATVDLLSDQEYTSVVVTLGLKQCPSCGIGIERIYGCIHMTCPYGHEFCYTCLKKWRTCRCDLYHHEEIEVILNERAGNDLRARERIRGVLLEDDDLHEHEWSGKIEIYSRNPKKCFNCKRKLHLYYYTCHSCEERRCGSCRYHA
jgi:hypothetical protein